MVVALAWGTFLGVVGFAFMTVLFGRQQGAVGLQAQIKFHGVP